MKIIPTTFMDEKGYMLTISAEKEEERKVLNYINNTRNLNIESKQGDSVVILRATVSENIIGGLAT